MFFQDKVHPLEVVKWGLFAGFVEGMYIALAAVLYANQDLLLALVGEWEYGASLVLLLLIVVSAVATSIIVFAHPIYSVLKKNYKDALLTIAVTLATIVLISLITFFLVLA